MFNNCEVYPTLYKRGTKGEVRCWRMELGVESDDCAAHRVVSGIEGGAETASGWSLTQPKNVGKKNATTAATQAEAEITALYTKKLDRGYWREKDSIDIKTFTKPMLATDWAKRKSKVDITAGVWLQPKLDGIRCIARADGLWTRSGKEIKAVPHIWNALLPMFVADPDLELDGELYAHHLKDDFNRITSAVRKQKPSPEDIEAAVEIEYHIYDMSSHTGSFSERAKTLWALLQEIPEPVIFAVATVWSDNIEQIDRLYGNWIEAGYEGQMIRLDEEYQNKRSNFLMKRKDFYTDEFMVVSVEEGAGNWSGCVKRFILSVAAVDAPEYNARWGFDLDAFTMCGAGVRGTQGQLRDLLDGGDTPDWATLRYFTPTPDGIPRFPVVVDWGWGSRTD